MTVSSNLLLYLVLLFIINLLSPVYERVMEQGLLFCSKPAWQKLKIFSQYWRACQNSTTWGAQNHVVLQLEAAVTAKLGQRFELGSRKVSASSHEFWFQGTQILPSSCSRKISLLPPLFSKIIRRFWVHRTRFFIVLWEQETGKQFIFSHFKD